MLARILTLAILLLTGSPVWAACTNLYQTHVVNLGTNVPLPGASVTVYLYNTVTKATIYDLSCTPISNPMTADSNALATFQADGSAQYQVTWSYGSYVSPGYYYFPSTYVPGAVSATGYYASGAYVSGFTTGLYMDYASNFARFSVATGDGFKWYKGGVGSTLLMTLDTNGALTPLSYVLPTGSTSVAPLKFTSGTLNTTAQAGALEYDGSVFYASPAASTRGVSPSVYWVSLTSTRTLAANTSAQAIFAGGGGPTNGALTLPVGTYKLSCNLIGSSFSGANPHTLTIGLAGTATIASSTGVVQDIASNTIYVNLSTSNALVYATSTTANIFISGIFRVSVTGTVIPQITQSVAASGVIAIGTNCTFTPLGLNTTAYVGNWN